MLPKMPARPAAVVCVTSAQIRAVKEARTIASDVKTYTKGELSQLDREREAREKDRKKAAAKQRAAERAKAAKLEKQADAILAAADRAQPKEDVPSEEVPSSVAPSVSKKEPVHYRFQKLDGTIEPWIQLDPDLDLKAGLTRLKQALLDSSQASSVTTDTGCFLIAHFGEQTTIAWVANGQKAMAKAYQAGALVCRTDSRLTKKDVLEALPPLRNYEKASNRRNSAELERTATQILDLENWLGGHDEDRPQVRRERAVVTTLPGREYVQIKHQSFNRYPSWQKNVHDTRVEFSRG